MRQGAACLLALALLGCNESNSESDSESGSSPRVVSVLGTGSEQATGFAVAPGQVVTVAHAVPEGAAVRLSSGAGASRGARASSLRARVVLRDARADLALLAVRGLRASGVETATVKGGDSVRLLLRRGGRVTRVSARVRRAIEAHVSAAGSRPLSRPALELDAPIRAGDSGAPVLTDGGELAGVLFARSRRHARTAYAVDAAAVEELLASARR